MRQFTCLKAVTHPSTNRARCRATALIETNALPLHQTANPNHVVYTTQFGINSTVLLRSAHVYILPGCLLCTRLAVCIDTLSGLFFPAEPRLAGFFVAKDDGDGGDHWSHRTCKAPVKSPPPTNQHPVFYRPDALPVAQPSASKH